MHVIKLSYFTTKIVASLSSIIYYRRINRKDNLRGGGGFDPDVQEYSMKETSLSSYKI